MNKIEIKKKALDKIDEHKKKIIEYAEEIWKYPELGFKEFKTAQLTEKHYQEMEWSYENDIAITGSKAYLKNGKGPVIGIVGELDALHIPVHPSSHSITGNVHACGHHSQMAAALGACIGLDLVKDELDGNIVMIAVPAEEYIEIDYRNRLREEGKLEFFGGKQEFIRLGAMNDIDIIIGSHSAAEQEELIGVGGSNNGFIGKLVQYIGREAHAGSNPDKGINALNAAMLGLMGIHANRETFNDKDTIRVHPIITKGGEIVNNVPSDVRMESYVRGKTVEALAVGAEVKILDHPGYMPYTRDKNLDNVIIKACTELVDKDEIKYRGHSTGSTDMGDFSCIMPTTSIAMAGCNGPGHSRHFKITDPIKQYIIPAKAMTVTIIDLLYDRANSANDIIEAFAPIIKQEKYVEFMHKLIE
jgi:amidohydrolase